MTVQRLRDAAQLMRNRANAAVPSPWEAVEGANGSWWVERPNTADIAIDLHRENAVHIAGMHPDVARAVADLLDAELDHPFGPSEQAITLAEVYLGDDPR